MMPPTAALSYRQLALTLLRVPDPFAHFVPPPDIAPSDWYPHSALEKQPTLAQVLAKEVDGYMLELGSFIGNSAAAWVRALRAVGKPDASVVCMDTWLGDVQMWHWRGTWLTAGKLGEPRLYEQFMTNSRAKNVSSNIVPMRTSAVVGLRYLRDLIVAGKLPPPKVIYLDAAHMYPETQFEAEAAWEVLAPGGYLIGDDYDHYWPEVQQSVNEFVLRKGPTAFVPPARFTANWPRMLTQSSFGRVKLLDQNALHVDMGGVAPLLKQAQWILKKAPDNEGHGADPTSRAGGGGEGESEGGAHYRPLPLRLRCCLNGWAGYHNRFDLGPSTSCEPPMPFLQQAVCRGNESRSVHCRFRFTCR